MKQHNLWFILSLACLASGCESALTYEAQCENKDEFLCIEGKQYQCIIKNGADKGVWQHIGDSCGNITVCEEGDTKCNDEKLMECQKNADGKYEWTLTDKPCTDTCEEGDTKCNDGKLLKCKVDNSGNYNWTKTDESCSAECYERYTKCSSGNIYTCTKDGKWEEKPTQECSETGCSEGTIQPANNPLACYECGEDKVECDNDKIKTCINHKWIENICEYGCNNAKCNECGENEKKCEDGYIYECKAGKWDEANKIKCEYSCFNGMRADNNTVSCNECNEGDMNCTSESESNAMINKCIGNRWHKVTDCALGCSKSIEGDNEDYHCNICENDKSTFNNDENEFCIEWKCVEHELSIVKKHEVSCNNNFTDAGDCLNGTPRCDNNNLQICTKGAWKNYGRCNSDDPCSLLQDKDCYDSVVGIQCKDGQLQACNNNASCKSVEDNSLCASCQNDTNKCSNNNILTCMNGEYQETPCGTGKHCETIKDKNANEAAQCVQNECENSQQQCQDNAIQTCENYKWKTTAACVYGEQCKESDGKAACSCISGTAYCDGTTAKNCKDGQWKTSSCEQNKSCTMIGGEAKCIDCESGAKCKDKSNIMTCQNNAWSAATPCSDGMSCTGDDGNAKCVCTKEQAVCDSDKTKIKKCKADGTYGSAESCGTGKHCEGVAGSAVCTSDPTECAPGAKQCDGNKLKTCNSKGKWETQTCEKGCSDMKCNECNDGEDYYTDENEFNHKTAVNCVGHKWITTDCYPNLSVKRDDLKKAICTSNCKVGGPVWCEGAGQARYRCTTQNPFPNDPAYEPEGAPFYALDGTCECDDPGVKKRCNNDTLQICNNDGKWEDEDCYYCDVKNTTCYPECYPPQSAYCNINNANILKKCNAKGKLEDEICEFGCSPFENKCYPECKPGQKKCDKDDAYSCDDSGNWDVMHCADTSFACNNGECVECKPNSKKCEGDFSKSCSKEGKWEVLGTYCIHGCTLGNCNSSAEDICNTGDTKCVTERSMAVCLDNKWFPINCPSKDSCSDNKCSKLSDGCTMNTCKAIGGVIGEIYMGIPCNKSHYDYSNIALCSNSKCNICYKYL